MRNKSQGRTSKGDKINAHYPLVFLVFFTLTMMICTYHALHEIQSDNAGPHRSSRSLQPLAPYKVGNINWEDSGLSLERKANHLKNSISLGKISLDDHFNSKNIQSNYVDTSSRTGRNPIYHINKEMNLLNTLDQQEKKSALEFRSLEEQYISQQCLLQGEGYLHFVHMRKAGGTTIRSLMNETRHTFEHNFHFRMYHSEGLTFNINCFGSPNNHQVLSASLDDELMPTTNRLIHINHSSFTNLAKKSSENIWGDTSSISVAEYGYTAKDLLHRYKFYKENFDYNPNPHDGVGEVVYLTALREPMSRIVSSYLYEGYEVGVRRPFFKKPPRIWMEPREWIEKSQWVYESHDPENGDKRVVGKQVWISNENYYVRTLVDRHRPDAHKPIQDEDLILAKRILKSFDLVIITEWFSDPQMLRQVARLFGYDYEYSYNDIPYSTPETSNIIQLLQDEKIIIRLFNDNKDKEPISPNFIATSTSDKIMKRYHPLALSKKHGNTWSKAAREGYTVQEDVIEDLKDLNKYDMDLYEYAKRLTQARMEMKDSVEMDLIISYLASNYKIKNDPTVPEKIEINKIIKEEINPLNGIHQKVLYLVKKDLLQPTDWAKICRPRERRKKPPKVDLPGLQLPYPACLPRV